MNLKTTLRDAIAVESPIVRVEADQAGDRSTRKADLEINELICFVI